MSLGAYGFALLFLTFTLKPSSPWDEFQLLETSKRKRLRPSQIWTSSGPDKTIATTQKQHVGM